MNKKYPVITLCGSTRFKNEFLEAQKRLTLEGNVVISVGLFGHSGDTEVWDGMDEGSMSKTKEMLDDMHKQKIDMSDAIFVINVNGYIGESTRAEIIYAREHGKEVRYLEDPISEPVDKVEWKETTAKVDLTEAKTVLKKYFGYDSFKPGQEEIIAELLSGRDVLAVMPTGAGKSICYQVPALLFQGITIVISPLISLMQDQVKALNEAGINAAFINSLLSDREIYEVLDNAASDRLRILYVAPERLENTRFQGFAARAAVSMVAVDEAHCISQWGQDFRPSYLKIIGFIQSLPKRPVVGAFTATATKEVKEDINCTLNLVDPFEMVTGFDRENLYFQVEQVGNKTGFITDYIGNHKDESGIIYCATRKNVEMVYQVLADAGVSVTRYHAGLSSEERKKNQDDFIYDRALIVVATNAFGMGIDKSNVRYVIHFNMPQSMENYYQEAGRAGRDGEVSNCILLFSTQDVMTQKYLLDRKDFSEVDPEDREIIRERDIRRLSVMENYCRTTGCLRNYILRYFGESPSRPCDNCGNCHREFIETDMTDAAKQVINCVYESRGRYGVTVITGTLLGANRAKLREFGTVNYKTYGILSNYKESDVRDLINTLVQEEYLIQTMDKFSLLKMGPQVEELRDPDTHIIVRSYREKEAAKTKRRAKTRVTDSLTTTGFRLFEKLRELRTSIAREEGMPPYIVFNDKTLIDMCARVPVTREQMLDVNGVGENKYAKYGERFIEVIQDFLNSNDKPTTDAVTENNNDIDSADYYRNDSDESEENCLSTTKSKEKERPFKGTLVPKPEFEQVVEEMIQNRNVKMSEINSLIKPYLGKLFEGNLKKISVPRISNWLLDNGYLIRVSDGNGISHREASEKGKDIGLINVQIELDENRSYIQYMFTPEAQKYIFKNLAEIGTYKR